MSNHIEVGVIIFTLEITTFQEVNFKLVALKTLLTCYEL